MHAWTRLVTWMQRWWTRPLVVAPRRLPEGFEQRCLALVHPGEQRSPRD